MVPWGAENPSELSGGPPNYCLGMSETMGDWSGMVTWVTVWAGQFASLTGSVLTEFALGARSVRIGSAAVQDRPRRGLSPRWRAE
jgi:hypothetical protein